MNTSTLVLATVLTCSPVVAQTVPTIDQLVSLRRVGSPVISPDGRRVAYTVRETNWDENAYETEIWLADVGQSGVRQLTNGKKSSSQPAWSPDGRTLAFVSDRNDKRQVYLIDLAGGEAAALTAQEDGVSAFAWAPDGRQIAFTAADARPQALKDRDKKYGEFEIAGQDLPMTRLYVIDLAARKVRRLTDGAFSVGGFAWSPDAREIAFDFRADADPGSSATADISVVSVADGTVRPLVTQAGPDSDPHWSPDGRQILFETAMGNPDSYSYSNALLAVVPASGGSIQVLSQDFDEVPSIVGWTPQGIFFSASHRTWSYLYRLDPASRQVTRLAPADEWIGSSFTLSRDAATVAFVASDPRSYPEVFVAPVATMQPTRLTSLGTQTDGWTKGTHEVISWKSQDGATIEGVLHKPAGFEAGKRYPLLVVIHGGPTGVSRPTPFGSTSSYPIDVWLAKGALVLEPNYRGSAGYGQAFRSLNIRNLGIGDAWDVISGIDDLVKRGLADTDRVGTMGWSQGGYISAFLTTHDSARFKAVSVGAGISDWMTYYVNTDIHPFTRHYLKATPWDDPEIYRKTSPITYIKQAKAPTLIQHGEKDPRVPIPNAYELYQGLVDQHVPAKLIVYKGFGHGLTKPKANRAAMEHNLEWFGQYVFGEKVNEAAWAFLKGRSLDAAPNYTPHLIR
jgi:dipeptidyl aminopeptidase/acylaminoacyl peptidase